MRSTHALRNLVSTCSQAPAQRVLTLVDGNLCLHQAFHATKDSALINVNGEPVGAIYVFSQLLLRLRQSSRSSHLAVMMDTRRDELQRVKLLKTYKASRRPCPADLLPQFQKAREACEAFGVQCKEADGYEADDLIATYTREATREWSSGYDVRIVSNDKDLTQLISPKVHLHDPRDLSSSIDISSVRRKWRVSPHQMGDLLALMGDASDNIPGVPGIGAKRAADLLKAYHNLEGVFSAVRSGRLDIRGIGTKTLKSLRDHEKRVFEMRDMIELQTVPNVDAAAFREDFKMVRDKRNMDRELDFCKRQNFDTLVERIHEDYMASNTS
eukprot:TRINITY_DN68884_c0_g1_i1.p1 TRINITY_DN68884_c0_g1~~TRINITY_DN68884_c0_g1_i1.p1  ORF type:complete len:327 (-),score=48.69 TRINITY_DN68884_c0_g1_i1:318-1298(-)